MLILLMLGCSKGFSCNHSTQRQPKPSFNSSRRTYPCVTPEHNDNNRYVSIDVLGHSRRVYLTPPVGSGSAIDLVVAFHGRGRNGEHVARDWRLGQGPHPYIGMYPDGIAQPWFHNLVGWDTRGEASNDLALYDAILTWSKLHYCLENPRVHVLGHSWGGGMANLVACARKGVHSLVSVGGGGPTFPCQAPVAAMIVHGSLDQDEPIISGQLNVNSWSFYNRCGPDKISAPVEGCVQFLDCRANYPLLWCEHPGAHGWPDLLRDGKLLNWLQR